MSQYQKGKINLDFTEARDSEWQWHQLGHMQVCISLQTNNHASTTPLSFLQAGCPFCHPTNSVKALKARYFIKSTNILHINAHLSWTVVIVVITTATVETCPCQNYFSLLLSLFSIYPRSMLE